MKKTLKYFLYVYLIYLTGFVIYNVSMRHVKTDINYGVFKLKIYSVIDKKNILWKLKLNNREGMINEFYDDSNSHLKTYKYIFKYSYSMSNTDWPLPFSLIPSSYPEDQRLIGLELSSQKPGMNGHNEQLKKEHLSCEFFLTFSKNSSNIIGYDEFKLWKCSAKDKVVYSGFKPH